METGRRPIPRGAGMYAVNAVKPVAKLLPEPPRTSLRDLAPKSVGVLLQPFPSPEDDMLEEMLNGRP
jgi:hypothetical protein